MKLTPAQRKVLEAMATGQILYQTTGIDAHVFLGKTLQGIRWATFERLRDAGLIEQSSRTVGSGMWRITDAGRDVITTDERH